MRFDNETAQWPFDQRAADHAQHRCSTQIGFHNQAISSHREVTHRCQVIQVEITRMRQLECQLRPSQLLVLQLQLNLVHLQVVHQLLGSDRIVAHGCGDPSATVSTSLARSVVAMASTLPASSSKAVAVSDTLRLRPSLVRRWVSTGASV